MNDASALLNASNGSGIERNIILEKEIEEEARKHLPNNDRITTTIDNDCIRESNYAAEEILSNELHKLTRDGIDNLNGRDIILLKKIKSLYPLSMNKEQSLRKQDLGRTLVGCIHVI